MSVQGNLDNVAGGGGEAAPLSSSASSASVVVVVAAEADKWVAPDVAAVSGSPPIWYRCLA